MDGAGRMDLRSIPWFGYLPRARTAVLSGGCGKTVTVGGECSIQDCVGPVVARGWCDKHYRQLRGVGRECSVSECALPPRTRGWCEMHYSRWKVHGDPLIALRNSNPPPECSVSTCFDKTVAKGLCKYHYYAGPAAVRRVRPTVCKESDCPNAPKSRGLCSKHYSRVRSIELVDWRGPSPETDPARSYADRPRKRAPVACSVVDCAKRAAVRGWCGAHYQRWRRFGDPTFFPPEEPRMCSLEGCRRSSNARGFCSAHYRRWQLYGDPLQTKWRTHIPAPGEARCDVAGCDRRANVGRMCSMHYGRLRRHGDVNVRSVETTRICATCGAAFDPGGGRARKYCGKRCKPSGRIAGSVNKRSWVLKLGNEEGWNCWLCNEPVDPALHWPHRFAGSVDHVVPVSLGGTDERKNLRLSHLTCNTSKKANLLTQEELTSLPEGEPHAMIGARTGQRSRVTVRPSERST